LKTADITKVDLSTCGIHLKFFFGGGYAIARKMTFHPYTLVPVAIWSGTKVNWHEAILVPGPNLKDPVLFYYQVITPLGTKSHLLVPVGVLIRY